ncbi:GTPase Era [Pseudogracilibacillus auburnensis]|uniref:GTPase Era n=1 Tax=Pseudogracilibacillus auburnensis TaxID=1494959 RepID=A0A2V3W053_9BACI|nr:GTPase Era [Pseudogracilibacillus auburnensis]PXW86521.1 GTP-binding protein Era [Pseudogracilibacillus auburnensis]
MESEHVSGFVTIIGRPNVGKSTLMNQIIGEKISIISDKIQTTRHTIHGILSEEDAQIIFIDTPGIHKPKHRLGDYMVDVSIQTLNDVDVILFMINAKEGYGKGDEFILEQLSHVDSPVFLLINKVDLIHPDELFPLIEQYKDKCDFEEIIPISALNGNNVNTAISYIKSHLPAGPKYYDENQITNKSERFLLSELIREKVLTHTKEEVPHSINVMIESMEERNKQTVYIQALIITERKSQKGILIGKNGKMLKKIGQEARVEMEEVLGKKVFLDLWVKIQKDWRNRQSLLTQYGFNND